MGFLVAFFFVAAGLDAAFFVAIGLDAGFFAAIAFRGDMIRITMRHLACMFGRGCNRAVGEGNKENETLAFRSVATRLATNTLARS